MITIEPIILVEQRMFDSIQQVDSSRVSAIIPHLRLIAHQNNLNLKRQVDFEKATTILIYSRYLN